MQQPGVRGARSRLGCSACKSRKRRCGEERPVCRNCVARGLQCSYPYDGQQIQLKFRVSKGTEPVISLPRRVLWHFINFSVQDVGELAHRYQFLLDKPTSKNPNAVNGDSLSDPPLPAPENDLSLSTWPLDHSSQIEKQLFQYYLQVICRIRVFQDDETNKFRHLVVPLCQQNGPLLHAVISLSANDRQRNATHSLIDYGRLSLKYKLMSLARLRQSLADRQAANENIMACLILCSLEIASGSRPDWTRHTEGALTILQNFAETIDPRVHLFAYYYFHLRRTFLRTTVYSEQWGGQTQAEVEITPNESLPGPLSHYSLNPGQGNDSYMTEIQAHMGCSPGLIEVIAQINQLMYLKRRWRLAGVSSLEAEEWMLGRATLIRSQLDTLKQVPRNPTHAHLQSSARCFYVAADLYIRLACDITLTQSPLRECLRLLLNLLGQVIREGQGRQLFPMWPLFVAGCLSIYDTDRQQVLQYFSILTRSWPVSNIPSVCEAVKTVWKSRDLNLGDAVYKAFDWQFVIGQMGWKLALS